MVRESDRGGGDAAVRVLENAELKYTLEELLKKSAGAAHYSLCVVKYSVAIKRRSQNARGWILNLLEREPCLADGAAGSTQQPRNEGAAL